MGLPTPMAHGLNTSTTMMRGGGPGIMSTTPAPMSAAMMMQQQHPTSMMYQPTPGKSKTLHWQEHGRVRLFRQ